MEAKKYKIDAFLLKKCVLWPGSLIQQEHQHGDIQLDHLRDIVVRLEKADNRSKHENEWLQAIKATIKLAEDVERAAKWVAATHDQFVEQMHNANAALEKSGYTGSVFAGPIGETKKEK